MDKDKPVIKINTSAGPPLTRDKFNSDKEYQDYMNSLVVQKSDYPRGSPEWYERWR